jgi:hypothetical protein
LAPNPAPPELSNRKDASAAGANPNLNFGPDALTSADLDGDGIPDPLAITAGSLTATLSRDGRQTVTLPPPVGTGAGVLGVTVLSGKNGTPVTVVFVRLTQAGSDATDTIVALVNGRLTVLQQGAQPVLLTIDPTHGYACDQRTLAEAGDTRPLVVDGSKLVASPNLNGVIAPPGKVSGCF